jgi:hypothetical protein
MRKIVNEYLRSFQNLRPALVGEVRLMWRDGPTVRDERRASIPARLITVQSSSQSAGKEKAEKRTPESQADWGSLLENNAAKASRALGVFSVRFFNHSRGASNGERAAFAFLPRGFLALRVCRNCSCNGESFLINFAFINLQFTFQ